MSNPSINRKYILLATAAAFATTVGYAQAAASTALEEIVVTAQKRAQSFNDVGVTVGVLSGAELADAGVKSLVDVATQIPNLQFKSVVGNTIPNITIRGIGLNDYASNNNPAAGIYVDNVYLVSPAMLSFALFDVERVEVLKGPQGDLYGRNTTAGAVNIISRRPSDQTDVEMRAGYGSYQNWHFSGAVGGALSPTLTARFALNTEQQESGWQTNYVNGKKVGKIDRTAGRLALDWQASDNVNVLLNVHAGYDRFDIFLFHSNNNFTNENLPYANEPYVAGASVDPRMDLKSEGTTLTVNWEVNSDLTLTSISNYEHLTRKDVADWDGTSLKQVDAYFDNKINQYSEELRFAYEQDNLNLIGGLYYSHDTVSAREYFDATDILPALGLPGFNLIGNTYRQRTEAYAGYLHAEYTIVPKWTLVGGIRYTEEKKKFDDISTFVTSFQPTGDVTLNMLPPVDNSYSTSKVSGKIGVNYEVADDSLIYASVSKSFKSGGFQGQLTFDPGALQPFEDENLVAYELGVKSRVLPNLQVNASVFNYDYKNMQFYGPLFDSPVGVLFGITNVGDGRIRGAEGDVLWRPVDGLDVRLGVGTIDTKVTESIVAGVATGSKLPNAPKVTANGMIRYEWPLSEQVNANISISGNYQSGVAFDIVRNPVEALEGGYFVANAQMGLLIEDHWKVSLWGKNLFDKRYRTQALTTTIGWTDQYGAPRTVGLNLSYKM